MARIAYTISSLSPVSSTVFSSNFGCHFTVWLPATGRTPAGNHGTLRLRRTPVEKHRFGYLWIV